MPELPEVETVRRGLAAHILDRSITKTRVLHPRAVRRTETPLPAMLRGQRFTEVDRRGKFLWLPLSDGEHALVAHLGMSGQLLLQTSQHDPGPHLRVRIAFDQHEPELRFVDQRTFGWLAIDRLFDDDGAGRLPTIAAHIARDPLDPYFDDDAFITRTRAKDTQVKRALLDQTLISGVGNIYADEALWRAKLHGRRPTARISKPKLRELLTHIREVMTDALAQGGTSFDDLYVNVNGESGYFERSLNAYGQEGEPCPRCGTAIRREAFMNRSSYFCPRCQGTPRVR
jgi:formamidopyrimidine-DNA glycosylase